MPITAAAAADADVPQHPTSYVRLFIDTLAPAYSDEYWASSLQ
jgi:hypothetical protein